MGCSGQPVLLTQSVHTHRHTQTRPATCMLRLRGTADPRLQGPQACDIHHDEIPFREGPHTHQVSVSGCHLNDNCRPAPPTPSPDPTRPKRPRTKNRYYLNDAKGNQLAMSTPMGTTDTSISFIDANTRKTAVVVCYHMLAHPPCAAWTVFVVAAGM